MSRPPILRRKWYFTGHTAFFVWESWDGEDDERERERKEEEEEQDWWERREDEDEDERCEE